MQGNLPLTAIRAFEAAMRHENFARAGAELNMTQAAVSYQVKRLEHHLGCALFHRKARRVELTETGALLGKAMHSAFDIIRGACRNASDTAAGLLIINAPSIFAYHWLAPRLADFWRSSPTLEVRLDCEPEAVADLQICLGKGPWLDRHAVHLFDDWYMPFCSPDYLDRQDGLGDLARLCRSTLLGDRDRWSLWLAGFAGRPVDLPFRTGYRFVDEQHDIAAALAGEGIALAAPWLVERLLAQGMLIAPFRFAAQSGSAWWLLYNRHQAHAKKIRSFKDWAVAVVARSTPQIDDLISRETQCRPRPAKANVFAASG